jgi:hypothetical protein
MRLRNPMKSSVVKNDRVVPTPRAEVEVAALDGMIYVLGGQSLASPASKLNQE